MAHLKEGDGVGVIVHIVLHEHDDVLITEGLDTSGSTILINETVSVIISSVTRLLIGLIITIIISTVSSHHQGFLTL